MCLWAERNNLYLSLLSFQCAWHGRCGVVLVSRLWNVNGIILSHPMWYQLTLSHSPRLSQRNDVAIVWLRVRWTPWHWTLNITATNSDRDRSGSQYSTTIAIHWNKCVRQRHTQKPLCISMLKIVSFRFVTDERLTILLVAISQQTLIGDANTYAISHTAHLSLSNIHT